MISSSSIGQEGGKAAKYRDERGVFKKAMRRRKEAFAQSVPIFRISFKLAWTESHQLFKRCNMMLPLLRQICKPTPRENKK